MGNICKISATSTRTVATLEDPVTAHRTNELLNRWRSGEVTRLQRLYRKAKTSKKVPGLDKSSFFEIFSSLGNVGDAVFSLFDSSGSGSVSFRDFCRALAWCGRGSQLEKLRFIFCMFAIYEQQQVRPSSKQHQKEGTLAALPVANKNVTTTTPLASPKNSQLHEELALGDLDDDGDVKLGPVGLDALLRFAGVRRGEEVFDEPLTFQQFLQWADRHLGPSIVDKALEPLMILSTPRSECDAVTKVLLLLRGGEPFRIAPGEPAFLLATPWWTHWCAYTSFDLSSLPPDIVPSLGVDHIIQEEPPPKPVEKTTDDVVVVVETSDELQNQPLMPNLKIGGGGKVEDEASLNPVHSTTATPQEETKKEIERPEEMDNSGLLTGNDDELKPDLVLGKDFVLVPREVWDLFTMWYGGGPALPRTSIDGTNFDLRPLALRVSACDRNGELPSFPARRIERFHSDLELKTLEHAEVVFRALFATAWSEIPEKRKNGHVDDDRSLFSGDKESLFGGFAGHSTNEDIELDDLAPGQKHRIAVVAAALFAKANDGSNLQTDVTTALTLTDDDKVAVARRLAEFQQQVQPRKVASFISLGQPKPQGTRNSSEGAQPIELPPMAPPLPEEPTSPNGKAGGSFMSKALNGATSLTSPRNRTAPAATAAYPQKTSDLQMVSQPFGKTGDRILRGAKKGVVRIWSRRATGRRTLIGNSKKPLPPQRWRLLSSETSKTFAEAGVEAYDEVMIEFADPATQEWPRARYVEPYGFRDFHVGDRLDACDYRGRWLPGTVVAVDDYAAKRKNVPASRIRVHFDKFVSKWDEWFDVGSANLAPFGSRVVVVASSSGSASSSKKQHPNPPPPPRIPPPAPVGDDVAERTDDEPSAQSTKTVADAAATATKMSQAPSGGQKDPPPQAAAEIVPSSQQQRKLEVLPGATGLVNLGNTCFMNSALQCLSHTPLLRAYCLSEGYASEINRTNPLGSQGRMVEEFAAVLRQLWSDHGGATHVAPSKFKRTLARLKPQFAGNDQHDSQEFLAEMLDMLHEDVNRVVEKPYVVEPDDDQVDKLSSVDAAREAWERYLLRNRSVIVDLFQGQLMSERTCETCQKRSLKFETFMYLSVPLPAPRDRPIKLALLRKPVDSKLDPVKLQASLVKSPDLDDSSAGNNETSDDAPSETTADPSTTTTTGTDEPTTRTSWFGGGAMAGLLPAATTAQNGTASPQEDEKKDLPRVVKYVFEVPRLGTVGDLKQALSDESGVPAADLVVGDVFRHRFIKLWHDSEPLARVGDDECVAAYEATSEAPVEPRDDAFPENFDDLDLGSRVDALDSRGHWYIGSVVAIDDAGHRRISFDRFAPKWDEWYGPDDWETKLAPPYANSKRRARTLEIQVVHRRQRKVTPAAPPRQQGRHVPPRHGVRSRRDRDDDDDDYDDDDDDQTEGATDDEEDDYRRKGMSETEDDEDRSRRRTPTTTTTTPRRPQEYQRRYVDVHAHQNPPVELFGTPFVVRIDSDVMVSKLYAKVVREAQNFVKKSDAKKIFDVRIAAIGQATTVRWTPPRGRGTQHSSPRAAQQQGSSHHHPFAEAPDILASGPKVLVSDILDDARAVVTIDWLDPGLYDECFEADDVRRAPSYEAHLDSDGHLKGDTSTVSLASCLDAFSKEETLSDDNVWFCPKCKENRHAISRILPWKLPDILVIHMKRFLCSAQWREKINTRVDFPLSALDMRTWVHPDARTNKITYDLFAVINHLGGMTGGYVLFHLF